MRTLHLLSLYNVLALAPAAAAAPPPLLVPKLAPVTTAPGGRSLQATPGTTTGEVSGFTVLAPGGVNVGCDDEWCTLSGEIRHSEALFGVPPYGGSKKIVGTLHYLTPSANQDGCDAESYQYVPAPQSQPAIFLIDAGACSFVDMVRIAEKKGAAAVVVADARCLCDDEAAAYTPAFAKECAAADVRFMPQGCTKTLPFMGDDGSGGDVSVPSLIISRWDGDRLADCYLTADDQSRADNTKSGVVCGAGKPIVVSMAWDMPSPDGNVEWDLWTNSDSDASFKVKFTSTARALELSTTFTPHYFIWDGVRWGCTKDGLRCASQCTHEGRYCNPDPDSDLEQGVSGADIVRENLRQLCVWQQAAAGAGAAESGPSASDAPGGGAWWEYASAFAEECHGGSVADPDTFNEACSKRVHAGVEGISWGATQRCVEDSNRDDGSNALLEAEIESRMDKGILALPTAVVNNVVQRGAITPTTVLTTICSGFLEATEPELCRCVESHTLQDAAACAEAQEMAECSKEEVYCEGLKACAASQEDCAALAKARAASTPTLSVGGIIAITFSAVALVAFGGLAYWRNEKKKVRNEVREILQQYMPLEEIPAAGRRGSRADGAASGGEVMLAEI